MQGSITRKRTRHGDFADVEDLFNWPRLSLHQWGVGGIHHVVALHSLKVVQQQGQFCGWAHGEPQSQIEIPRVWNGPGSVGFV